MLGMGTEALEVSKNAMKVFGANYFEIFSDSCLLFIDTYFSSIKVTNQISGPVTLLIVCLHA